MVIDTHTADGLKVAHEHRNRELRGGPMIVLETALPIKFAETIVEALGREPDRPAKFEGIEALPKRVLVMDADVAAIQALIARECQKP
jgi:threonine synthase